MPHAPSHLYEPLRPSGAIEHEKDEEILAFDRDAVRAIDRAAIEEFGIPGIVLMENAARGLTDAAMRMLDQSSIADSTVLIICGNGNNGGDGFALARHLHNRGFHVTLAILGEPKPQSDAGVNRAICKKMNLAEIDIDQLDQFAQKHSIALIVDAIFGTGLGRPIAGRAAQVIDWINASKKPVLAADVPSGMDCNTGEALGRAVRASNTVTFVGLKIGFLNLRAQSLLGEVEIADIGAPVELLERFGKPVKFVPHPEAPEHALHQADSGRAARSR